MYIPRSTRAVWPWAVPGLVAGGAFLGVAMAGGATTGTPWSMPDAIAAVVGMHVHDYRFRTAPSLLGVAVHLLVSVFLGIIFLTIARWLRLGGGLLVFAAWLFSGLETPISIWVVLHTIVPHRTFYFLLQSIPFWASFWGRHAYGLVLGLLAIPVLRRPGTLTGPRRTLRWLWRSVLGRMPRTRRSRGPVER